MCSALRLVTLVVTALIHRTPSDPASILYFQSAQNISYPLVTGAPKLIIGVLRYASQLLQRLSPTSPMDMKPDPTTAPPPNTKPTKSPREGTSVVVIPLRIYLACRWYLWPRFVKHHYLVVLTAKPDKSDLDWAV